MLRELHFQLLKNYGNLRFCVVVDAGWCWRPDFCCWLWQFAFCFGLSASRAGSSRCILHPVFSGGAARKRWWRFLSLAVASSVPRCGEKDSIFLLTQFRWSSARAFMGELYTRFLGAGGWNRKGGESMLLLALLLSLNFLEFPLVSLQFLNDFCLTGFWKLKRRHPRNTLKTRKE